jgi:hypothetical protein
MLKLVIACCVTFSSVKAQTVNDVKLSDLKEDYLEVTEYKQFLSEKTFVAVDYGQKKEANNFREAVVRNEKGKYQEYNSVIDFVNKMKLYSYELFQVYVLVSGTDSKPTYVLKRKAE